MDRWNFNGDKSPQPQPQPAADTFDFSGLPIQNNNFTWEMIGLGLEEPLPPQESIDELLDNLFPPALLCYAAAPRLICPYE